MRSAALLVFAACWVQPVPAQTPVIENSVPIAVTAPPATAPRSVWQGRYVCAQGFTALRLTIERTCNRAESSRPTLACTVVAMFEFSALPENPSVPSGSYEMTGEVHANENGELVVSLVPDRWIQQPNGYEMVGISATSDRDRTALQGRIDNPSCGAVTVTRVE